MGNPTGEDAKGGLKMSEIDDLVKRAVEKEKARRIQLIKESVFEYIKEHNGKCDMVDVACQFNEYTIDVPGLAVHELIEEGRVEYRDAVWNIQPYRLFVR